MSERMVLITGASGEIGQALIHHLAEDSDTKLVTVDLEPLPDNLKGKTNHMVGDLLDKDLINTLGSLLDFNKFIIWLRCSLQPRNTIPSWRIMLTLAAQ